MPFDPPVSEAITLVWRNKLLMLAPLLLLVFSAAATLLVAYQSGAVDVLETALAADSAWRTQPEINRAYESSADYLLASDALAGFDWIALLLWATGLYAAIIIAGWKTSTITYALALRAMRGKRPRLSDALDGLRRYLLRYAGLRILILFAALLPLALIAATFVSLFPQPGVAELIAFLLIALLVSVVWTLFLVLRFVFASPAIFLEDKGSAAAFSRSFSVTHHGMRAVLMILLVLLLVWIAQSMLQQPFTDLGLAAIFGGPVQMLLAAVVSLAFIACLSFLSAFDHTFLLLSYDKYLKSRK